jgi:site-specific recombinase XerD
VLRGNLAEHLARTGRIGPDRCFGATGVRPFDPQKLQARADKAWRKTGLERITPHECRHSFAALMIAAGVNAKALQSFMGALQHYDDPRHIWASNAGLRE